MSWIAAYGAGFRTVTYLIERIGLRRRLMVRLHKSVPQVSGGPILLVLRVANPGAKIKVVGVLLSAPKIENAVFPFTSFTFGDLPYDLDPEDHFVALMNGAALVRDLRSRGLAGTIKVESKVLDSLERSYRSNRIKLNLDKSFFPILEAGDE